MPRRDFDPAALDTAAVYPLLNSVVIPRPIAWVSTRSADGIDNLAPHSFFTISSVAPPVVQFTSVGAKDSVRNCRETGEFVVALSSEPQLEAINATGTDYPASTSEWDAVGIEREPSRLVAPPRVAASPVNLECRVVGEKDFGSSVVVFGEVVWFAVEEAVLDEDDHPRSDLLRPLTRLGKDEWARLGPVTSHRRIPFAEL